MKYIYVLISAFEHSQISGSWDTIGYFDSVKLAKRFVDKKRNVKLFDGALSIYICKYPVNTTGCNWVSRKTLYCEKHRDSNHVGIPFSSWLYAKDEMFLKHYTYMDD